MKINNIVFLNLQIHAGDLACGEIIFINYFPGRLEIPQTGKYMMYYDYNLIISYKPTVLEILDNEKVTNAV